MLLNVAAHNVSIQNVKVSKCERHRTYSVTKRYTFLWRCTLCNIYVMKTLRFGTLTLCSYVLQHYVMWRLRYVALRYVATSVNHVLDSGRPTNLNPPASCSGRLFWSKDPLSELRGWVGVWVRGSKYLLHLPLLSPALWLVAGLQGPTPSIANHLPTWREGSRVANLDPAREKGVRAGTALLGWVEKGRVGRAGRELSPGPARLVLVGGRGGRQAAQWRQSGEGKGCQ